MPPKEEYMTKAECSQIHHERAIKARWVIGLVFIVLVGVTSFAVAHITTDAQQTVRVEKLEEGIKSINNKIDKILDILIKTP